MSKKGNVDVVKKFLVFGKLFLLILVCEVVSAGIIINEVMVHPDEDAYDEWVELYNEYDSAVNLSEYRINDESGDCDNFLFGYEGSLIPAKGYAVITDQFSYVYYDYNVSSDALRIRVEDAAIGNGLGNSGDKISLYNDSNCSSIVDSFSYNNSVEEWSWALVNNTWQLVENITPGYSNSYTKFCDPSIEIEIDKYIYEDNEVVYFTPVVKGNYLYNIDYWIEDLFGNVIKRKVETGNSNQKQWTADVNGEDSVYVIKANLTYSDCDDIISGNNFAQKTIGVKGTEAINTSFLNIETVYLGSDSKAGFGDNLRVKVNVYKGDTDKQSIQLWVEDSEENEISKRTRLHAYEKFRSYNLTLAVQIEPNCKGKYKDGYYNLVFEGLGQKDKKRIKIEGITTSLCERASNSSKGDIYYEILEIPSVVEVGDKFAIKIRVGNNASESKGLKIWSYVYRGSKCYSESKENNLEEVNIPAGSSVILELNDVVKRAEEGDYKLKIKFKKDDRKTEDEITKSIRLIDKLVIKGVGEVAVVRSENSEKVIKQTINPITGAIVYESKEKKEEKLAIYFFCLILVLLVAYFMWGNEI